MKPDKESSSSAAPASGYDVENDPAQLDSPFNACMFKQMCIRHRNAISLREQREPSLTYPPEAASWVAIKGDKPVAVVEKAAYDDLRARHVALRERREGMMMVELEFLEQLEQTLRTVGAYRSAHEVQLLVLSAAPSAGRRER